MVTGIEAPAPSDVLLDEAIRLMRGSRVAVLTGAGVSTDSGIPDYRGEGAPVRTPMTAQTFVASETARKRYWAGSHLGWRTFGTTSPMKDWPPNPGLTVMTQIRSMRSSTNSTADAGVPGLSAIPAFFPIARIAWSERWT